MPAHSQYTIESITNIPLNNASSLFTSSSPDPSTPPDRQTPRPDLAIHMFRTSTRRSPTPLPSSITLPLQHYYSFHPPQATSAQRPRQVSFEELIDDLIDQIQDVGKIYTQAEQDFLSQVILTISSYPDNHIPDAATIIPSSSLPIH